MATKKISELEAITEADDSDVLAIVDVSEGKTNKITKNNLLIGAGHSIEMSLNQETYALTFTLKNAAGTELSTASIDLPNENSITNISYNNGKLTLTKQSGTTTEVDISGLINGLVTESDFETFTTQLNQVLQELDETKADAEDVEALQTRVTELEQENEDLKKNQLTNTPTPATSHYLQDSADSRFRKFIPIGRTTQESTTGANLMKFTEKTNTSSGATYECDDKGQVTITGTTIYDQTISYCTEGISLEAGSYKFKVIGNASNVTFKHRGIYSWAETIHLDNNQEATLTVSEDISNFSITSGVTANTTYNCDYYITLAKGTTATTERFTGGEPAPNPNYPQDIKNTGDNANEFDGEFELGQLNINTGLPSPSDSRIRTKNFQEIKPNTTYTISGVSAVRYGCFYDENQEYIKNVVIASSASTEGTIISPENAKYMKWHLVNYTDTNTKEKLEQGNKATPYSPYGCGNVNEKVQNKNLLKIQKDLHLMMYSNGTISSGSSSSTICQIINVTNINNLTFNGDFSLTDSQTIRVGLTYDFPAVGVQGIRVEVKPSNKTIDTSNYKYVLCTFVSTGGSTASDIEKSFQLEEGSSATDFIAHQEQNPSFPLAQGQKFYEGSHPDDDEKVHHKMGEMVLPPINSLTSGTVFGVSCKFGAINIPTMKSQSSVSGNFFCDKVKYANGVWGKYQGYVIAKNFVVLTDLEDTVENFNSKISGATLQFPLEQETTEAFTEEQKTAWEEWKKARTYKNVTHISSEDETPANVEIEYVQDNRTLYEDLKNAIISLGGNV